MKVHLIVIDPQVDFCDPGGSLYVPGADADMQRLASFVEKNWRRLEDVHVTLDSHRRFHVANHIVWRDKKGDTCPPFTPISVEDMTNGTWRVVEPFFQARFDDYVRSLESNNRYGLMTWPLHCLIGSPGHCVYPALYEALAQWEDGFPGACVDYVTKGSNPFTEHYSAVMADVPDPNDPTTGLNTGLIRTLKEADVILWAGEARNYCLRNTMADVANEFGDELIREKFVYLEDATSDVPDGLGRGEQFVQDMTARGMRTSTTVDFF